MKSISKKSIPIVLASILFIMTYSCISNTNTTNNETSSFKFEQIGYFKKDQQRVFTFYINSTEIIDKNNVPEGLWRDIETHGKKQMNTQGKNTQSFYYLSHTKAPDVTQMKTYEGAIDRASENEPIALVYIMFNGDNGIVKNPKE